jgi:heme/copper-type cytochrome/quinol oxidase subunit 4
MAELVRQRATIIFGLLVTLTALSFWLTVGHGSNLFGEPAKIVWTQVIVLAFIKVRWILLDFMELRTAAIKLRVLFEGFVVAVAAMLIAFGW